jgi:hypothetical protein
MCSSSFKNPHSHAIQNLRARLCNDRFINIASDNGQV